MPTQNHIYIFRYLHTRATAKLIINQKYNYHHTTVTDIVIVLPAKLLNNHLTKPYAIFEQ